MPASTGGLPAAAVATSAQASLVEVSPSTVMRLKLASTASPTIERNARGSTAASVAMNASIVAMSGRIIPEPLAIPVTVTVRPPRSRVRDAPLGTVSVVAMAAAASSQPSPLSRPAAAGTARSKRSTGSGSPMTPVENGSTLSAGAPVAPATSAQHRRASSIPRAPVPAFAFPALTSR